MIIGRTENGSINLFQVPTILFEGISKDYGAEEEEISQGKYRLRKLDEESIKFPGVIGLCMHETGSIFCLWPKYHKDYDDICDSLVPKKLLLISALEKPTGSWCVNGTHGMCQEITIQLNEGNPLNLESKVNPFIFWVMKKTYEIVYNHDFQGGHFFWTKKE